MFYLGKKLMNFIVSDIWDTNYISFNYKLTKANALIKS